MDARDERATPAEEATQWWARIGVRDADSIPHADREQFTRWLRESPVNVAELLHVAHVHDALGRFKSWDEVKTDAVAEESNVVVPAATHFQKGAAVESSHSPLKIAAAAGIALLAIIAAVVWSNFRGQLIETDRAERREVMLSDGSVVQLEPQTAVRVTFKINQRSVSLERGRALFRVTKDPQRPFVVRADQTSVRVLGTSFGVDRQKYGVVVTVAEGKVAVNDATQDIFLTANQQFIAASSDVREPVRTVDTTRALAWAQGRLVFENDTLDAVIAEFNRYNRVQLFIDDSALAARKVSGVFVASDPDTLLAFIKAGTQVNIVRKDEQRILIAPSP